MPHTFNEACNGCSACYRQCPNGAIYGTFQERYHIDADLCIDCGVCGMICPVGAVNDETGAIATRVPRGDRLRPIFDPALCNGCGKCADFCRFEALKVIGPHFRGVAYLSEPMQCVSCGECVEACIKGAVQMRPNPLTEYEPESEMERIRALLDGDGSFDVP